MLMGGSSAWAEDTTTEVSLSAGTFSTDHITWSIGDAITIQQLKGSSTNAVNSSYIAKPRVYKGHILAFEASTGYVIKSISIKCDGSYIGNSMTAGTEIVDNVVTDNTTDVTRTWTTTNGGTHVVSNTNGLSAIYIQNVATSNVQLRPTEITVTYASSGDTPLVATTTTIDATGITNTDVYVSTAAGSLSATVKDADNIVISGAAVTWSSSDTSVATIASDGTVTLVGVGTTTITASYAGVTDEYQGSHGTYELTVTSSEPYVQPTEIEITPNYTFWGKTGQFSGSTYSELSGSQDNVTLEWSRGNGSTYANTTAMRFYKDNTLTFTAPDGYEIKSIELEVSGTYDDLTFSPEGYDNETKTWTGSSATVTMSRPSTASSYATISKYTITLGTISTDPSITSNDVSIAYDATSGSIEYTINNEVDGGSVSAAVTQGDWLTLGQETASPITFTCSANSETTARTATVTLTYTYGEETVSKNVNVTQAAAPVIYTTIPALFEAATSTSTPVNVTFGNWVVSGVNGNQLFVTDGTYGFIVYQSKHGFEEGNILSGTASCNLVLYDGSAELTGLTSTTSGLTVETGGNVTPVATTIDALGAVNTGSVVTLSNLTYDGTNLSDGTNTIIPWNTLHNGTYEDGKTYNITGVFVLHNNDKRILPRSAADIEEVETPIAVTFSEEDTNDTKITDNAENVVVATLTRTLSNAYWSTFSVPFNVTADQVTAALGEGVELRKFQGSEGTVIKFQEATAIEAGYAYLVKPAETVTNPVFEGVTVVNTIGEMDADDNDYGFVGAVIKTKLAIDKTELFLGTDGKFYYPESDAVATMKGLRGYFVVPAGAEPSKLSVDVNGSGIATSINSMNIEGMDNANVYNLQGQRVNAPQKGLYIMNGKKVIIK